MTCIVGYLDKHTETVYIIGDSAAVANYEITARRDLKVFKNGPFVMGFTSSFRMGQLLMSSKFKPKRQIFGQTDYDYMITTFIDTVRDLFKNNGFGTGADENGGSFLVGYRGKLYTIECDFQVGENIDCYDAVGCGESFAKGAMEVLLIEDNKFNNDTQIRQTLHHVMSAVVHHSAGVSAPFNIVSMTKKESDELLLELEL